MAAAEAASNASAGALLGVVANKSKGGPQLPYASFGGPPLHRWRQLKGDVELVELHIGNTSLQQVHDFAAGSVAEFLLTLHPELCQAAGVDAAQLTLLGVHGRYRRPDGPPRGSEREQRPLQKVDEMVVVEFELEPPPGGNSSAAKESLQEALDRLRASLDEESSVLRQGRVGQFLRSATVLPGPAPWGRKAPDQRQAEARLSQMSFMMGVSAAFTGALLWIAAW